MPSVLANITIGELVAWTAGIVAAAGILYKLWQPIKALQTFLRDWSGKPARKDRAGNQIAPAEPGVLGRLDTLRGDLDRVLKQVENSHNTNFRDDLDVVRSNIERVSHKLDEHIEISKDHDRFQFETQKALDDHIRSTQRWTGMLEDLHELWSARRAQQQRPPDHRSD